MIYSINNTQYNSGIRLILSVPSLGINNCLHTPRHAFVERFEVRRRDLLPDFEAIFFSPVADVARSLLCSCFICNQSDSMGFRSGLFPSQPPKSLTPCWVCHCFVVAAQCAGAPSSINSNFPRLRFFALFDLEWQSCLSCHF